MTDEKLEKLLREDIIDVPEAKYNSRRIIEYCEEKTNKRNIKQKRLIISLSSFVLLTLIVLSFVLMNNQYYSSVIKVNKAIDGLDSINDSSVRMKEIMKINNEIKTLSLNSQEKVNMDKLSYELKTTTTNLKNAVDWSDVINYDATYFTFDEIINKTEVKELFVKKGLVSNTTIRLTSNEFTDSLIETFYLPYIDIIDSKESFYEDYKVQLSGDTNDFCSFQINDSDNTNEPVFNIYVYGSGYVLITETIKNELTKAYISLISLDYSEFKLAYGAYSITSDFYFNEIVSFDSIKSISVTESTYWALLGRPETFIGEDQILDYYNNKLKNLKFTENDELVKSIQSELGSTLDNDTTSITIVLNDNESVVIFASKTTHRFIITHGMMTYAGVGTIEYE